MALTEDVAPPLGAPPAAPGAALRPGRGWSTRRSQAVGWSVLGVGFVLNLIFAGLPYSEDDLLLWISAALFVASLGDLKRWRTGVIRDWLPLYAVLAVYGLMRGYAHHVVWGPFAGPQVALDKVIGLGGVPTVTLQRWLFRPASPHVWDYAVWGVYMTHFFVSFTVAAWLWKRDHPRFRRFVALFVGLTAMGFVTYVAYPALPPWLASQDGVIGPAVRLVPVIWNHVGLHGASAIFSQGSSFDNDVAAVPSLHCAYPLLLALFFWPTARRRLRIVLATYVVAMAFTLVYSGEHFVTDELLGWLYALVAYRVGSRLLDLRARRRAGRVPAMAA